MNESIDIKNYNYALPDEKIAKYPLKDRSESKLLVYNDGVIEDASFKSLPDYIPTRGMVLFNNTKVIRARLIFFKETGARIEIFCLEPSSPASYERALAARDRCMWRCMIGNAKKWKEGVLKTLFVYDGIEYEISAMRLGEQYGNDVVEFSWSGGDISFGELLELLGKIPIPPYLNRESEEGDNERYQTVYSRYEGSVAAPTAGLHFTDEVLKSIDDKGIVRGEVTLHVGAGTFLPVKCDDARDHNMHIEHFSINLSTLRNIYSNYGNITAVGTTTVRTLESLTALAQRVILFGDLQEDKAVGQWEAYTVNRKGDELLEALINYMEQTDMEVINGQTAIMITPYYKLKIVNNLITNFHQPQSTLLLLLSAFVGNDWKRIYNHALHNDYRFLSYGDSSLILGCNE